ncbi:MAG: PilZ domain-containing protein [Bacteriovoracaceae bacterium]|nr:PilZ domain-containing protein [Bacteriovoracaceae bacterium]
MSDFRLQRKFTRAPLKSQALYVDGEHVFKAKVLNLSEGGILLSELPHFPETKILPIAVSLIHYPRFAGMVHDELKQLSVDDFERSIVKTTVHIMRNYENQSNVDKVFINYIGCEFYKPSPEFKLAIFDYVDVFSKNTIYLLSLFESLGNRAEQLETLRTVAHLLGYDRRMKVPLLRAKVLHDYQSLESI